VYVSLLILIYLSVIRLGLPDSLLGSAWIVMRGEMGVPVSYAGIIAMIISGGTIVSSLCSDALTKKIGTGLTSAVSVLVTAVSLLGFARADAFWMLCLWAVPNGLGAGAIDAALNNYVALNYASKHLNWLHCCWGVGAATGPYIMGARLTGGHGWNSGYEAVFFIQIILAAVLFAGLPLWKKNNASVANERLGASAVKLTEIIKIKGVVYILPAFFAYCALEQTAGLWASSYLVLKRGVEAETAARYASFFFFGITAGRFVCGFVSDRIGDRNMIRLGTAVTAAGIVAVMLPLESDWLCLNGLIAAGVGCAPIYPSVIHATPLNFGKDNSQAVIGVQMASAYMGITLMPPLFGLIADKVGIGLYPIFLFALALLMFVMTEKLNLCVKR
jgi:fucose permease